jgi:hypothetical protein
MSAPTVPPSLKKWGDVFGFPVKICVSSRRSDEVAGRCNQHGPCLKEDALPDEKTVNFLQGMR